MPVANAWDGPQSHLIDYYYHGARRIQEVATTNSPLPGDQVADREYIYGPDYVDEFIAQLAPAPDGVSPDTVIYITQDANYNVAALFDGAGNILHQYTYTPYGRIVASEEFTPHPINRIGHQGLFFDHFDAPYGSVVLTPDTIGLYYNRNRFYDPATGRFIQPDPNETGIPLLAAMARHGEGVGVFHDVFDGQGLYADGMNLFLYAGANPITGLDPSGLDEIDDLIDDLTGHKVAALGFINESAAAVGLGLNLALEIAGSLLGFDVFESVAVIGSGRGGFFDALNIAFAVSPIGRVTGIAAKVAKWRGKFAALNKGGRAAGKAIGRIRHHVVPKEILQTVLPKRLARDPRIRGKRGAPNKWWIPEDHHLLIHSGPGGGLYNELWRKELTELPGGRDAWEVEDVVRIRDKMVRLFELEQYRP